MAVLSSTEVKNQPAAQDVNVTTTSRIFIVELSNGAGLDALFNTVVGPDKIPIPGSTHPDNSSLFLTTKRAESVGKGFVYRVTCDYTSFVPGSIQFQDDPLKRPSDITWGNFQTTEPVDIDTDTGLPIINSAGKIFQDPVTRQVTNSEVTIVRNESLKAFSPQRAVQLIGSVNKEPITIAGVNAGKRCVKLEDYSAVCANENDVNFWRVTYRLRFNRNSWVFNVLDIGFDRIVIKIILGIAVIVRTPILDGNNKPIKQAVPLDGAGQPLGIGLPGVGIPFNIYDDGDFSTLGLGATCGKR